MIRGAMTCAWVMLGLAIGGAGVARATDFDFSYTAHGMSVMGIFNTSPDGPGQYLITGITNGTRGGTPMTLLAPQSRQVNFSNDNVLYFPNSGTGYLDGNGLGFTSGDSFNLYSNGAPGTSYTEVDDTVGGTANVTDFQVAPVPAPIPGGGLLSFLAAGVAGLLYLGRPGFGRLARFKTKRA